MVHEPTRHSGPSSRRGVRAGDALGPPAFAEDRLLVETDVGHL